MTGGVGSWQLAVGRNERGAVTFAIDRKENVRVENGWLIIEARKDSPNIAGTLRDYSSGRVRTKHRGDWKYGRVSVRARLPEGQGIWPAIWMMPTEDKYGGWALSGEIDLDGFGVAQVLKRFIERGFQRSSQAGLDAFIKEGHVFMTLVQDVLQ